MHTMKYLVLTHTTKYIYTRGVIRTADYMIVITGVYIIVNKCYAEV